MSRNGLTRFIGIDVTGYERRLRQLVAAILGLAAIIELSSGTSIADERAKGIVSGIKVPDGFHVELYADDDLTHDVHSMTIDAKGGRRENKQGANNVGAYGAEEEENVDIT